MTESSMQVDTEHLRAGSERCDGAAGMAAAASTRLAAKAPVDGIFGDFPAASAFHRAIAAAHLEHVDQLQAHQRLLGNLGEQSGAAADHFDAQDTGSADALRSAQAAFGVD